jgi:hypothetical protein
MSSRILFFFVLPLCAQQIADLVPHRVKLASVDYSGKKAIRIVEDNRVENGGAYAVVNGSTFHNGEIEVDVAGRVAPDAGEGARGFIGVGFRKQGDEFEYFYIRPTNGRAEDQVRRNHSTQYASHPKFDFAEFRKTAPEKYESYVDLEPGAWTHLRIAVDGVKARFFVHGAAQPCLIVNDLKRGDSSGEVLLWIGPGTEGHFANLKVTSR